MSGEIPPSVLRKLNTANVRLYALRSGWKQIDGLKRPVIVLNHPTDGITQIQLPTAGSDRDRAFLLGEALEKLSISENRPVREILSDLSLPSADKLRLAMQSRDADTGTLPLDEGLNLWKGGRDMILAAACSAHQPQAYYPRQSFAAAQDYLRTCRLGQTEQSSYVATIFAPVPPELTGSLFDDAESEDGIAGEPYERKVTMLLMEGLQTIRLAIELGNTESLLQGVSRGVSANLCDAVASMSPSDVLGNLQISMIWSRARPRIPKNLPHTVSFAQAEFGIIREAGRRLREKVEPHAEQLEGVIISLHAEPANIFEDFKGKVVVRSFIDGRPARVRFELTQSEYAVACDAHRDRRRVGIKGILQRDAQAKVFELLQPQRFTVLPQSDFSS